MTELDESPFINAERFYKLVDDLVWAEDISYLDAIMIVCDNTGIDPEDLVKRRLISVNLKEKLRQDAIENGILKQTATLPI